MRSMACTSPRSNTELENDPEWRYMSFDGFISEDETFQERLKKDWDLVSSLGRTHVELAQFLRDVLILVEKTRSQLSRGPMSDIIVEYTPPPSLFFQRPQKLSVSRNLCSGHQYSLFFNPDAENSTMNLTWNEEYVISNCDSNQKLTIAGGLHGGILDYIEQFGFYEGGPSNPYRVDPRAIIAVLSGRAELATGVYCEATVDQIRCLTSEREQFLFNITNQKYNNQAELEWFQGQEKHLLRRITTLQAELET